MSKTDSAKQTTAVIIFSRTCDLEAKLKSFSINKNKNLVFWDKQSTRSIELVKRSQLPYFIFDENNQIGQTFGEKIANAMASVFEIGFQQLIIIGNDCPLLTTKHIIKTQLLLKSFDFVAGPDVRGGVYLLGVNVQGFEKKSFINFSWQSQFLLEDIQHFYGNKSIYLLDKQIDINTHSDIKKLLIAFKSSFLLKKIIESLLSQLSTFEFYFSVIFHSIYSFPFNKGSPSQI